jgi:hypothetical protein
VRREDAWRAGWGVPDRRPTYDWAADGNIYLPPCYTRNGLFSVAGSRWLIPIFDALDDDLHPWVTVIAPPRTGKSMVPDVWIPSTIVRDPGPTQWLLQTDKVVKDYAESRIQPILKACPGAMAIWPEDRHKSSTLRVAFRNGCDLYISGPSISNLQTKGIRRQVRDEFWLWPERLKEADARLKDWLKIGAAKALSIGQAGWKDDAGHALFKDGDQGEWFVRCLECGHLQWPRFNGERPDGSRWGVVWDLPKRERTDHRSLSELLGQILPTVRFECEQCRKPMVDSERTRAEWDRTGEYKAQNATPRAGCKSFRASGTCFRNWKEMVTEFLGAMDAYHCGAIEPLIKFVQKEIPDFWSDLALFNSDPLRKESYDVRTKWEGEDARFLTVDRQADGLMFGVARAWSKTKGSRRLWRGRLFSEDEIKAKAKELQVPAFRVLIDSGHEARIVYGMCVRNGWIALKGEGTVPHFLHAIKRDGKTVGYVQRSVSQPSQGDPEIGQEVRKKREGARYAFLLRFADMALNQRLQRLIDGRGLPFVNPTEVDDPEEEKVYKAHLRAEYPITKRNPITGAAKRMFVCPSGDNHYRDCEKMQLVGATELKLLPDEVATAGDGEQVPEKVD